MSLSSLDLWQRIANEGIASTEQCRAWAEEIAKSLPADDRTSGIRVLQRLIELQRLSNYQAKILSGQSSQPLRFGRWIVIRRLRESIWNGWIELRPGGESVQKQCLWARPLGGDTLQQLRAACPSLTRAASIASAQSEHLQSIVVPEVIDRHLLIYARPVSGNLLSEQFAQSRCTVEFANRIVRQVASALSVLHKSEIVHGRVLPDRVILSGEHATLAIDPLCMATATADSAAVGLLSDNLNSANIGSQKLISAQFIAPEFLAAGQLPSTASDVYSLGCLWWWLLTGQPPATSTSIAQALAEHAKPLPDFPGDCGLTEPLLRCLKHSLARNLATRFSSAADFLSAIDMASSLGAAPDTPSLSQLPGDSVPAGETPASALTRNALGQAAAYADRSVEVVSLAQRKSNSRRQRGSRNKWLLPLVGGCACLILLLATLKFSGFLQPSSLIATGGTPKPAYIPSANQSAANDAAVDPRSSIYQIVASGEQQLWLPPALPAPIAIDLLPPGGQLFVSLRPNELVSSSQQKLLTAFNKQLTPFFAELSRQSGVASEQLAQVTFAFYPPNVDGQFPLYCVRCKLARPFALSELQALWKNPTSEIASQQTVFVSSEQLAYYVALKSSAEAESITAFCYGPLALMREVAELQGARAPMLSHLERLWNTSDEGADVSVIGSAAFLFTQGRELLSPLPRVLVNGLKEVLGNDMRAAAMLMRFQPEWYVETRLIGASDQDVVKSLAKQQQLLLTLPAKIERSLVSESPHPHWRSLALRFPQMMRMFVEYTRFGVENGTAISNTYLPSDAAANLLLSSWIAMQDGAMSSAETSDHATLATPSLVLSMDEYLARPIRLSFDQEPIEVALRMVGEEANDQLPAGTPRARFVLDGDAFEKAGITRNQQLRNFNIENKSVREALTEIAKRGNPVTTVTDTRDENQRLIWVVMQDPDSPGASLVSLTTRAAASAAGIGLPAEFAAP